MLNWLMTAVCWLVNRSCCLALSVAAAWRSHLYAHDCGVEIDAAKILAQSKSCDDEEQDDRRQLDDEEFGGHFKDMELEEQDEREVELSEQLENSVELGFIDQL